MPTKPSALALRPDRSWALFLDVDGTVLHLKPRPDAVAPSARVCRVLDGLTDCLGGAVGLVSGRPISQIDALFRPRRLPAAGQHGLERRDARGRLLRPPRPDGLDRLRDGLKKRLEGRAGVILEEKSHALAVHYRQAPRERRAMLDLAADLVPRLAPGMQLIDGDMVVEIKPAGASKGSAIRDFMNEPPFRGRLPVFIGDDTTDEDGFRFVDSAGGVGIRVGPSERSEARYALSGVDQVVGWLEEWPELLRKTAAERRA